MADPNSNTPDDRGAAVREWEKQANASMVVDSRKKRFGGIAIAAIAAGAIAAVWLAKHSGSDTAKSAASSDISIPDRKPVPKLKDHEAASTSSVAAAPAPTPASTVQADDPMKAQREQMEMQRREQTRRLLEARMKSAIIPPNSANQPAGVQSQSGPDAGSQVRQNNGMSGGGSSDQGPQDANSRFARAVSGNAVPVHSNCCNKQFCFDGKVEGRPKRGASRVTVRAARDASCQATIRRPPPRNSWLSLSAIRRRAE